MKISLAQTQLDPVTVTYRFENNFNLQTATRTHRDIFPLPQVNERDLELVATRTWVRVQRRGRVEGHVFDFDLVVV